MRNTRTAWGRGDGKAGGRGGVPQGQKNNAVAIAFFVNAIHACRFVVLVALFAASSLVLAIALAIASHVDAAAPTAFVSPLNVDPRHPGPGYKDKRKSDGQSYGYFHSLYAHKTKQTPSVSSSPSEPPAPRKLTLKPFNEFIRELLIRYEINVTFSPESEATALAAIQGIETFVPPDAAPLVDLTDRPYITVDNDDSMDLDQAMFIAPWYGPPPRRGSNDIGGIRESGTDGAPKLYPPLHYLVSYALTDGRHFVPPTSPLFTTALERGGVSFYLPGLCVPMLPRSLSEGAMSLNENEIRRSLVFEMVVDAETGMVQHTKPVWAKVKSVWKGSYRLVQEYYDEEDIAHTGKRDNKSSPIRGTPFEETVVLLREIGQLRRRLMRKRNIVELHRSELGIAYDSKTESLVKKNSERYKSELFNEQISLMCNMEGARLLDALDVVEDLVGTRNDVSPIYRYQDAPREDQIQDLASLIDHLIELHSLDRDFFQWIPRGSEGTDFGGEHLGDYLKRLHHRIDAGTSKDAHPLEADVLRAIDRQAIMTNVGAHFGDEVRQHYSLRVDAYARFSAPMRELVGCFTHKQLWDGIYAARLGIDTSINGPKLRERVIDAAESAKRKQRRLSGAAYLYLMDAFFAPDLELPEQKRPRRPGAIIGIDSTAQSKKRRSRTIYVKIDELEVKVSVDDLKQVYGVRYLPTDTIGEYGLCVKLVPQIEGHAPAFFVGQSVNLSVFDRKETLWVFRIEPRTCESSGYLQMHVDDY